MGKAKAATLTWTNERRRISDLIEWEKNPRQLTEKQATDLAESLRKFGYVEPVAVNTDGTILGGHMRRRLLLAQALVDPGAEIDVRVPSRKLSELEVTELNVRLNRNTGEWDWDKLANEFDDEALLAWGFTDGEMGKIEDLKEEEEEGDDSSWKVPDGPFSIEAARTLLIPMLPRFKDASAWASAVTSLPLAMADFNALCGGASGSVGQTISLNFNPHRIEVRTVSMSGKVCASPLEAINAPDESNGKVSARSALALFLLRSRLHHRGALLPQFAMGIGGVRCANEFRPAVARDLYLRFLKGKAKPAVLDPCHGWGGRLVGFMAAQLPGHYVGVDPAKKTSAGTEKLYQFLKSSGVPGTASFKCVPFEDYTPKPGAFDLVFTSPPYFDTERYSNEKTQSTFGRSTFEEWCEGFLKPLLHKSTKALKKDGVLALNVGDNLYPISGMAIEILGGLGWTAEKESIAYLQRENMIVAEGESSTPECLIVAKREK